MAMMGAPAEDTVPTEFAAFGAATIKHIHAVVGVMTDSNKKCYTGVTLVQPPDWVIFFEGLPEGKGYTLTVYDADHPNELATFQPIEVKKVRGIRIDFPQPGVICSTFAAYGYADSSIASVSGLLDGNGKSYGGTTLQQPTSWVIQFSSVSSTGNNYTLTVSGGGLSASPVTGLQVDPTKCPPPNPD
jgi:hypothetical protein